jgi:hypothetical protein
MKQPVIGNFTIDVAAILHQQDVYNDRIIMDFKQLVKNI